MYVRQDALQHTTIKPDPVTARTTTTTTRSFHRYGNGRNGGACSSDTHASASTYTTKMIPHLPSGETQDMMITTAYGICGITKVCEKLMNFVDQVDTHGSVCTAYELRQGNIKTHIAIADNPDRNPYLTKNTFNDADGNSMSES